MDKPESGRDGRRVLCECGIRSRTSRSRARLLAVGLCGVASTACALDLPTLDKVSVMMTLDQVRQIAGAPDEVMRVEPEFTLATWTMTDAPGMAAAGGIFDGRNLLIAQAYVFAGETGAQALASLREFGFKVVEDTDGTARLYGKDDDAGRPIVVIIDEQRATTTVYAYEQGEYEKRAVQKSLPIPGAPGAGATAQSAGGGTNPDVRNAIAAALTMFAGPPGSGTMPGQWKKTTTVSSSSRTTQNPDGSITTRSSKTTVSVGVDRAGVANALLMLMK